MSAFGSDNTVGNGEVIAEKLAFNRKIGQAQLNHPP
jgi:hypothetical protein